jgi:hypothetical protein
MSQHVEAIMQQIDLLNEADRLVLEQLLFEKAEREWLAEANAARIQAAEQGIDQRTIDAAIEGLRRGS